ncbi:MAG: holo-ACP synthase [Ferrovum sp.]|nr:holo-ACP synthase [Ferrovum sp.]
MIVGLGVDLVSVERISGVWQRHGERFLSHILTPGERQQFAREAPSIRFLAKRFAVKEAFSKALGMGMRSPVQWNAIGTGHDDLGAPQVILEEPLKSFVQTRGIDHIWVSVSDEKTHAMACVVLEGA